MIFNKLIIMKAEKAKATYLAADSQIIHCKSVNQWPIVLLLSSFSNHKKEPSD